MPESRFQCAEEKGGWECKCWGPKVSKRFGSAGRKRASPGLFPMRGQSGQSRCRATSLMPGECGARSDRACQIRNSRGATEPEAHPCTGLLCICVREMAILADEDDWGGEGVTLVGRGRILSSLRAPTSRGGGGRTQERRRWVPGYLRAAGLQIKVYFAFAPFVGEGSWWARTSR